MSPLAASCTFGSMFISFTPRMTSTHSRDSRSNLRIKKTSRQVGHDCDVLNLWRFHCQTRHVVMNFPLDILFATGFWQRASGVSAGRPNLKQEVLISITVKNQRWFVLRSDSDYRNGQPVYIRVPIRTADLHDR